MRPLRFQLHDPNDGPNGSSSSLREPFFINLSAIRAASRTFSSSRRGFHGPHIATYAPPDLDHTASLDRICLEPAYCSYISGATEILSSCLNSRRSLCFSIKFRLQLRKALRKRATFSVSYHSFWCLASDTAFDRSMSALRLGLFALSKKFALGSITGRS